MNLSRNNGPAYTQQLAEVVSQAALHLHVALGQVGTALLDKHGAVVFNHNALDYANHKTLEGLAAHSISESDPRSALVQQHNLGNVTAYTAALGRDHVFIVIGSKLEANAVNSFLVGLREVIPSRNAND